jgi:hypothetical protein
MSRRAAFTSRDQTSGLLDALAAVTGYGVHATPPAWSAFGYRWEVAVSSRPVRGPM